MKNKDKNFYDEQKRKYFQIYRKKVRQFNEVKNVLENLANFVELKNYFVFWKSLLFTKYEGQQELIK